MSDTARTTASDKPSSAKVGRGGSAGAKTGLASGCASSVESAAAVVISVKSGPVDWGSGAGSLRGAHAAGPVARNRADIKRMHRKVNLDSGMNRHSAGDKARERHSSADFDPTSHACAGGSTLFSRLAGPGAQCERRHIDPASRLRSARTSLPDRSNEAPPQQDASQIPAAAGYDARAGSPRIDRRA